MLTRFRYKRDLKLVARFLSDKTTDNEEKEQENKKVQDQQKKKSEFNSEKVQELLKSMLSEPKINEADYRAKFATAPDIPRRNKNKDDVHVKMEKIEENISKAAGEVAQAIGGDIKQTEAELLSKVLGKINQTSTSLSDLIIGMKVDRSKEGDELEKRESRGQQVKHLVNKARNQSVSSRYTQRKSQITDKAKEKERKLPQPMFIDIFSGEPLGIFNNKQSNYGTDLAVWQQLKQRELALATAQPPTNYFQKMILWTEQGKVWKFPIDNEQGIEEEQKIHFSEHIFLDQHLEGWCPKKGPIRHFMELVCVGLSKNAFYTVQEKKDHIMWYKEYFESKKDVLIEVGAWDIPKQTTTETST